MFFIWYNNVVGDYMKNRVIYLIIILVIFITGCSTTKDKNISKETKSNIETKSNEVVKSMKVEINNEKYIVNLEDNETVTSLIKLLPLEVTMNELNGNEKYVYLDESLPTNSTDPKHINAGDVMLFGDNCLVIFYKSFDTSYSYTKIGHIDNLPDLGKGNIDVKISN